MSRANHLAKSTVRTTIYCCFFICMMCAGTTSAQSIFFDDFNDGDVEDGMPVDWVPGPGTWKVSGGDYIATGSLPRVSIVPDYVLGDTSTRALVRVDGNVGASLGIRRPSPLANPLVGYAGQILPNGPDGLVAIVRVDGSPMPNILGRSAVPFNPTEQDVVIQFDAFNDELSLWAWPSGEPMPDEPQLVVFDDKYAEGATGLVAARAGGDPLAPATFRFIHVANTHISLTPDFDADAVWSEADANLLAGAIAMGSTDPWFDVDENDLVDVGDLNSFLNTTKRLNGDADFDGEVTFADFVQLADNFGTEATWSEGDFDASGSVEFPDFLILSHNFGKSSPAAVAVPEPCTWVVASVGGFGLLAYFGRRKLMKY